MTETIQDNPATKEASVVDEEIELRPSTAADLAAIEVLYRAAFPEEDLLPLIRRLLREREGVLSLVAVSASGITGHLAFTRCTVEPGGGTVALLGPLCVAPAVQKQGIGSRLVRSGLEQLGNWKAEQVLVLGDPAYYGRFGFLPGSGISPPYPLPDNWAEAWQFLDLGTSKARISGVLVVPPVWQDRALWTE